MIRPRRRVHATQRARAVAGPLVVAASAAGTLAFVAAVDPNEPGHYPTCPFLALTGLLCPGCGTLRTLHAVAHADLAAAAQLNLLTLASLPLLAGVWVAWLRRAWTGRPRSWAAPGWALWSLLGVVLAFWLLRNLPAFAVLAP